VNEFNNYDFYIEYLKNKFRI